MDGHCHINTIFHRGLHSPTELLSHTESVRNSRGRTSVEMRGRKRRTPSLSKESPFACVSGLPKSCSTAACCAVSNRPRIERMRLEYQNAEASQHASAIALQEKEPMVAAARMALWDNDYVSIEE